MTVERNGTAPAPAPEPRSVLVVRFKGTGSAECEVTAENVTPAQVAAAAFELDFAARQLRLQATMREQFGGLQLPGMPGFGAAIDRGGD